VGWAPPIGRGTGHTHGRTAMRFVIVYQCGLANVFKVDRFTRSAEGRNAVRIMQHAYEPCAWFIKGLAHAGHSVRTAHCEKLGDCSEMPWEPGRGELWRESRIRVKADGL
jgi:hypothetical protein